MPHITRFLDPVRFPNPRWALACVVGFVEDIARDLITDWVGLGGFGEVSQGGWVGVVDDLIGRADPLGVPLDDVGGQFLDGFVLTALIGVLGGYGVAACAGHGGAVVVPTVGTAAGAPGAV